MRRNWLPGSAGGQVFLEYALVLPLVLLVILATVQLGFLAIAQVRFEAAVAQAARSYMVHGSAQRARQAAALVMVPSSLQLTTGIRESMAGKIDQLERQLGRFSASHDGLLDSVLAGFSRFVYAYAHTRVLACFPKLQEDESALLVSRGDPVRLDITFDVPLLIPIVAQLFTDRLPRARSDSAAKALVASPFSSVSGSGIGKLLDQGYNRFAKRRLETSTVISWARARTSPDPAPICVD